MREQNHPTNSLEFKRVDAAFSKAANHIRVIEYVDSAGHTERIETTDNHPFWVEGTGWVEAGKLTVGAELDAPDSSAWSVTASTRIEHPEGVTVYNMTVSGDHTYFVADAETNISDAVWVHNAGCAIPSASELALSKTASGHADRPFVKWKLFLQELMNSGAPRPDPQGVPNALRWDVSGTFNGSNGIYELVVDVDRKLVLHYLFRSVP
ncbi:MAG: polymorphic toxin-type HINT domain-containing protein [Tepidisphaeraceae bacterium]